MFNFRKNNFYTILYPNEQFSTYESYLIWLKKEEKNETNLRLNV